MNIGKRTTIQNETMLPENCKVYSLRVRGLNFESGCEVFKCEHVDVKPLRYFSVVLLLCRARRFILLRLWKKFYSATIQLNASELLHWLFLLLRNMNFDFPRGLGHCWK